MFMLILNLRGYILRDCTAAPVFSYFSVGCNNFKTNIGATAFFFKETPAPTLRGLCRNPCMDVWSFLETDAIIKLALQYIQFTIKAPLHHLESCLHGAFVSCWLCIWGSCRCRGSTRMRPRLSVTIALAQKLLLLCAERISRCVRIRMTPVFFERFISAIGNYFPPPPSSS